MTRQNTDFNGRGEPPTYDYIAIGAGPAGCAVAARIAQSSAKTSVALIEAGPAKASMLSDVPLGLAALLPLRSRRNYAYQTAYPRASQLLPGEGQIKDQIASFDGSWKHRKVACSARPSSSNRRSPPPASRPRSFRLI